MGKLVLVISLVVLGLAITCNAATYMVGDNSGWDISTDLDTWAQGKKFVVGDLLLFQYSSSHSLEEVKKEDFDSCNTTNAARKFTNGNTTVPLTEPGTRYFVCGNQLHCLGGMKLQVNVEDNHANPPIGAPQAQPAGGTLTQPSSKSNNPASAIPTSAGSRDQQALLHAFGSGSSARQVQIHLALQELAFADKIMAQFLKEAKLISNELAAAGTPLGKAEFNANIFRLLPTEYHPIIADVSARNDHLSFHELPASLSDRFPDTATSRRMAPDLATLKISEEYKGRETEKPWRETQKPLLRGPTEDGLYRLPGVALQSLCQGAQAFISEKVSVEDWHAHLGHLHYPFVVSVINSFQLPVLPLQ
uniref:Mavicyanin n=1 Tax=Populus alba TaxID=43335 RepID=A0A4U5P390_POPAL|nr:mavicyanin [Populus alba]